MSEILYELFLPEEKKDDRALLPEFLFGHFLDAFPLTNMMPEGSFQEEITKPLTWLYVDYAATMLGKRLTLSPYTVNILTLAFIERPSQLNAQISFMYSPGPFSTIILYLVDR